MEMYEEYDLDSSSNFDDRMELVQHTYLLINEESEGFIDDDEFLGHVDDY